MLLLVLHAALVKFVKNSVIEPLTVFIAWTIAFKGVILVAPTHTMPEDDLWYADSGAYNHITNDVANLSLHEPYGGDESVVVGNGSGLSIQNTGSLLLHTPSSSFNVNANLLSINQFCLDNDCFFILTSSHYFIKDNKTGKTLLEGHSEGGLYPIYMNKNFVNKCNARVALFGVKTSLNV